METSSELLRGLSVEELEALADCLLAPSAQSRLSDLLARKSEQAFLADEETELDRILTKGRSVHTPQDAGAAHVDSDKGGIGQDMTIGACTAHVSRYGRTPSQHRQRSANIWPSRMGTTVLTFAGDWQVWIVAILRAMLVTGVCAEKDDVLRPNRVALKSTTL